MIKSFFESTGKMIFFFLLLSSVSFTSGKVYKRCELARELKMVHHAPLHQLATWVCIARYESDYRTDAVGRLGAKGTADHGIFQINDRYWCSPVGVGRACLINCGDLEDDDITDDFECVQKIYKEHKRLSGDGFNAWAVYKPHCKGNKAAHFLKDCFNGNETKESFTPTSSSHGIFTKENVQGSSNFAEKLITNSLPTSKPYTTITRNATRRAFSRSEENQVHTTGRSTVYEPSNGFPFYNPTAAVTVPGTKTTTPVPAFATSPTRPQPSPLHAQQIVNSRIVNNDFTRKTGSLFPIAGVSNFQVPQPQNSFAKTATTTQTRPPFRPVFIFNGVPWY